MIGLIFIQQIIANNVVFLIWLTKVIRLLSSINEVNIKGFPRAFWVCRTPSSAPLSPYKSSHKPPAVLQPNYPHTDWHNQPNPNYRYSYTHTYKS